MRTGLSWTDLEQAGFVEEMFVVVESERKRPRREESQKQNTMVNITEQLKPIKKRGKLSDAKALEEAAILSHFPPLPPQHSFLSTKVLSPRVDDR